MARRRLLTAMLCLTALGPAAGAAQASSRAGADVPAGTASMQQVSDATLCLLNEQRAAAGLAALTADPTLARIAVDYAGQMATQHFFSHVSPSGQTLQDRFAVVGYDFEAAGENLAWAGGSNATAAQIFEAWMNSEGHRANILDPDYRQLGVGFATGTAESGTGTVTTYVTEFGTPHAKTRSVTSTRRARTHRTTRKRAARARQSAVGRLVLVKSHKRHGARHRSHR